MADISVGVDTIQQHFRLFELPPSILTSFPSDRPQILQLKSTSLPSSAPKGQSAPAAVLCTYDQTYELRQVQSSNILYILRTRSNETEQGTNLSAIAQCSGLLELIPSKDDVLQYLRAAIPLYKGHRISEPRSDALTPDALLHDAPFSELEVLKGKEELCVFEEQGSCWIPSPRTTRETWSFLTNAVLLEQGSIDKEFDAERVKKLVLEDGGNGAVFDAVMKRNSDLNEVRCRTMLLPGKCIVWLGNVLLQTADAALHEEQFLIQWRDQLPESWHPQVNLSLVQDQYVKTENDGIVVKGDAQSRKAEAANSKGTTSTRSKWHEKFKKNR